jgi:bifunctional DNA-binding transcriptional regulator/antitoxin component of YhaV-PrlF toxin-antitoxin module
MKTKLEKSEENLFVVVPKGAVSQLGWTHGDILSAEVVDGGLKIVRTQTADDHAMEFARKGMEKYHETFATLAKS